MGLTYKILWVDDQFEDLIEYGIKSNIEKYLEELGFVPDIECFEDIQNAEIRLNSKKYDLILSDYNIGGGDDGNGDVLITNIRNGQIFTEVLFYSALQKFVETAKNLFVDRVSFASIAGEYGFSRLEDKIKWLINQTILKLQEIESIRGLVMAETSHLDNLVEQILIAYFESNSENKPQLRNSILKRIEKSIKGNLTSDHQLKLMSKTDIEIVKSRLFDANKKARSINELIKLELIAEDEKFEDFFDNYKKDVLDLRNDLAHAKTASENGEEYLLISRGNTEISIKFDQEKSIEIRKNLLKYDNLLTIMKDKVDAGIEKRDSTDGALK